MKSKFLTSCRTFISYNDDGVEQESFSSFPNVDVVTNNDNLAEFVDIGIQVSNSNGGSLDYPSNQTISNTNNTLPDLDVRPNIAFAKTNAFYAILLTVTGRKF